MPPSELQKFTQFSVQILGGTSLSACGKKLDFEIRFSIVQPEAGVVALGKNIQFSDE